MSVANGAERTAYPLQKRLLWPLQDRAGSRAGRALATGAVVLLAAGAGVAGLLWAAPDGPHKSSTASLAAAPAPAAAVETTVAKAPEPTLQGAAPVFEPAAEKASSKVDPAQAIVKSAPADSATAESSDSASAATASSSSSGKAAPESAAVDGPPAGPAAVAVARDFSKAFVVYETGGLDDGVRAAFGATATKQLSRALLRRPPRLPASMKVPRAKVLNVVPGPSHAGVYSVSVSLLRVGVTSELRLDMEQLKGKEWRVTNVLG